MTTEVLNIEPKVYKGRDGWKGRQTIELNGIQWDVSTYKHGSGWIACTAHQVRQTNSGGVTITEWSPFEDPSIVLAKDSGTATERKVKEVHTAGLAALIAKHEAGELPKAEKGLEPGQVIFLEGYEGGTEWIYKVEGRKYFTVDPVKLVLTSHDRIRPIEKKFGIGWYYRAGEVVSLEEVNQAVNDATQATEERNQARRKAEEQAKEERARKIEEGAKILPEIPAGVQAVIIAELEEDQCDIMTDYFGSRTIDTIFLAWSGHTRDLFSEMRKAAGKFEQTKHLETAGPEVEKREKYSMGHGYYLGEHRYSGWNVSKMVIYESGRADLLKRMQIAAAEGKLLTGSTLDREPVKETQSTGTTSPDTVIKLNEDKGGIEIHFKSKPAFEVLQDLKGHGFRWSKYNKCWYKIDSPGARAVASKYGAIPGTDDQAGAMVQANEEAGIDDIAYRIGA